MNTIPRWRSPRFRALAGCSGFSFSVGKTSITATETEISIIQGGFHAPERQGRYHYRNRDRNW